MSATLSNPESLDFPPVFDQAELTLARDDGEVIKRVDHVGPVGFPVSPGRARYTLRAVGSRKVAHSALAPKIDTTWGFDTAEHPDPSVVLPLLSVRATAEVDDHSTVPAGRTRSRWSSKGRTFPRWRAANCGCGPPSTTDRAGRTCRSCARNGWVTTVDPPACTVVSLYAVAKAPDGSTVDQTVIRSYGLREAG